MSFIQEDFDLNRDTANDQMDSSNPSRDFSDILFLVTEVCGVEAAALLLRENSDSRKVFSLGIKPEDIRIPHEKFSALWASGKDRIDWNGQGSADICTVSGEYPYFVAIPVKSSGTQERSQGALLIFSNKQINLLERQEKALHICANQILKSIRSVQQKEEFVRVQQALEQKYHDLEKFASVVSHDIKSPLANIISLTELLREENQGLLSEETLQYLDFLEESSQSLRSYVDGLLIFYRSEKILEKEGEDIELEPFFREITRLYTFDPSIEITYPNEGILHKVNKAALSQIFMNLLGNALKYNFSSTRIVHIDFTWDTEYYTFSVSDNGQGIPEDKIDRIFDLFSTLDQNDRNGNPGSGIGLATVKKLVEHMGGEIHVDSEEGKGSTFSFSIKR